MPPVTRDLSVAVAADEDEETLGDRVREALGADAASVDVTGAPRRPFGEVFVHLSPAWMIVA